MMNMVRGLQLAKRACTVPHNLKSFNLVPHTHKSFNHLSSMNAYYYYPNVPRYFSTEGNDSFKVGKVTFSSSENLGKGKICKIQMSRVDYDKFIDDCIVVHNWVGNERWAARIVHLILAKRMIGSLMSDAFSKNEGLEGFVKRLIMGKALLKILMSEKK